MRYRSVEWLLNSSPCCEVPSYNFRKRCPNARYSDNDSDSGSDRVWTANFRGSHTSSDTIGALITRWGNRFVQGIVKKHPHVIESRLGSYNSIPLLCSSIYARFFFDFALIRSPLARSINSAMILEVIFTQIRCQLCNHFLKPFSKHYLAQSENQMEVNQGKVAICYDTRGNIRCRC